MDDDALYASKQEAHKALEENRVYLFRYALLRLRDKGAAEDAVQETLLAALENRSQFSGRSSARTWLVGILKHKIIDQIRRHSRDAKLYAQHDAHYNSMGDESDFDSLFARDGRHWDRPPQDWGNPDKTLEQKKFWEAIELCINLLPANTARVFAMREFMGLSTDEICKDLEITATNCWVMLYRARMSLRECLQLNWFDNEERKE